jgi:hypothetical protein
LTAKSAIETGLTPHVESEPQSGNMVKLNSGKLNMVKLNYGIIENRNVVKLKYGIIENLNI